MLNGEVPLGGGNVWLGNRYSVKTDLAMIQGRMGYCPQYDAFIPEMTGREMLVMFCLLRGIPKRMIKPLIIELSASLLLTEHLDRQCGSYSGGNKRKLSVAIALIGVPDVVLLDEPSTGVDPVARRRLWESLLEMKELGEQSIILTSHVMEECEVLCDRLCIMVKGQMHCVGTPQRLKAKYAQGYSVLLQFKSSGDAAAHYDDAFAAIKAKFEDARLKEKNFQDTSYELLIPVGEGRAWGQVFALMEEVKKKHGLSDYAVTQTTLAEIFMSLTLQAGASPRD